MDGFSELAFTLCPVPRSPFSEHDNDRLTHRDLDGCTKQQAADLLVLALVAQRLDYDPWRAERVERLHAITSPPKRRKRG